MKQQKLNKWIYWTSPLIGVLCNFIIIGIAIALKLMLFDYEDYSPEYGYTHLGHVVGGISDGIYIYIMSSIITTPFTYLYLTILNREYKHYSILTPISIPIALFSNFFICSYLSIITSFAMPGGGGVNSTESNAETFTFMLLIIIYYIPIYWVAHRYIKSKILEKCNLTNKHTV